MTALVEQVQPIVAAQGASRSALTEAAISSALLQIEEFDGWYSDGQVADMAAGIARTAQAAQRHTAALTSAYLTRVLGLLTGRTPPAVGPIKVTDLRSVPADVVYQRLGETYRYQRSRGVDDELARRRVAARMKSMIATDQNLAMRAQSQRVYDVRGIHEYRRVIHPELSKSGTCGLCIAASDRIYHRATLLPIHKGTCHCETLPIVGGQDPGHSLNRSDLDALYAAAGSTGRQDLSHVRYTIHDDGEIGPTLGVHGQHWRGPAEVAAA